MDVSLTTVGTLVDQVRFEGEVAAFLVDDHGELIYFTGAELDVETKLEDLDAQFSDAGGFAELAGEIIEGDSDMGQVV